MRLSQIVPMVHCPPPLAQLKIIRGLSSVYYPPILKFIVISHHCEKLYQSFSNSITNYHILCFLYIGKAIIAILHATSVIYVMAVNTRHANTSPAKMAIIETIKSYTIRFFNDIILVYKLKNYKHV